MSNLDNEIATADIKRALDNYTWEAWADGVMRTDPLMERWAMLYFDLKERNQATVRRGDLDIDLVDAVRKWKDHVRSW